MLLNLICKTVSACNLQESQWKASNENLKVNGRENSDRGEAILMTTGRSQGFEHGLEAAGGCCPLINMHLWRETHSHRPLCEKVQ